MSKALITLTSYTDPYCTWCWGSEPILRKIQAVYGSQVLIRYVMGGLVENIKQFHDPSNNIGGKEWYKQVASHWLEASSRHKMPVDEQIFFDIQSVDFSTYPASIAYEAANMQGTEIGQKYLRRLREAASAQRMAIQDKDVQLSLAKDVHGLDFTQFQENLKSGNAEKAFFNDLSECRGRGIHGFPTFVVQAATGGSERRLSFQPFSTFEKLFMEMTKGCIQARKLSVSTDLFPFMESWGGNVTPMEIATVFDLSLEDALSTLRSLATTKNAEKTALQLVETKVGNGSFFALAPEEGKRTGSSSVVSETMGNKSQPEVLGGQCDAKTRDCQL